LKFSLSTGTLYSYPLRWIFRLARETGFDGVELVVNPEAILRRGEAVRQLAQAEGVEILTVHPTVMPLPGWRERHGGMAPTIQLAREAGAGLVVMHTPHAESLDEGEGLAFRQRIEAWQGQLAGGGLRLAVENKAVRTERERHYALTPLARLRAFADRYDLGLVLDTTHAASAGEDLLHARQVFDRRLVNVHLSDMGGRVPLARLPGARVLLGQHRFPGDGDLALSALLADLNHTEYAGPVTLEVNPWVARAWWPPAVRRRLAQAIEWMRCEAAVGTLLAVLLLGHFWLW
jgi:sugar phosphate isomerase/epimerase